MDSKVENAEDMVEFGMIAENNVVISSCEPTRQSCALSVSAGLVAAETGPAVDLGLKKFSNHIHWYITSLHNVGW